MKQIAQPWPSQTHAGPVGHAIWVICNEVSISLYFVSRSNRRLILNEDELLEAVRPFANIDIIRFESLSVREQVSSP